MNNDQDDIDETEEQQEGVASYSIYEPHYQQMHPLIYYETDPVHHHAEIIGHHPTAAVTVSHHHHWDHWMGHSLGSRAVEAPAAAPAVAPAATASVAAEQQQHQQSRRPASAAEQHQQHQQSRRPQPQQQSSSSNREVHNEIERRRRLRIKQCCDALRGLVPGLNDKTDKATVLEHTVKFVDHLINK